jgi:putative glutamine amidotransferase
MTIIENTLLSSLFQKNRVSVNSMHKQAIDKIGENLKTAAIEDNGVIQAVEDERKAYYLGVQFHPEAMIYRADCRRVFKSLVHAARNR